MNRLFVVKKPIFISSNNYLSRVKRKYRVKKAGFSGTLDPFATGTLIVAFGQYTKLFRFLKKSPKEYLATIWLGTKSASYDIENIISIESVDRVSNIESELLNLKGKIEYIPPKFSAKSLNGVRAYKLAREEREVDLKPEIMEIFDIEILNYSHPFLSFRVTLSEGGYVRSIAQILSEKLGVNMTLSRLTRVSEGDFKFQSERELNPIEYLNLDRNFYLGDSKDLELGRKLKLKDFKFREPKSYFIEQNSMLSIVEIGENSVKYILNRIDLC